MGGLFPASSIVVVDGVAGGAIAAAPAIVEIDAVLMMRVKQAHVVCGSFAAICVH